MPAGEVKPKAKFEVRKSFDIVNFDKSIFNRFEKALAYFDQKLMLKTLFTHEKPRYIKWRDYRLNKSIEELQSWKELADEERWVLNWLKTDSIQQALDPDYVRDAMHQYAKEFAIREAKIIENTFPAKIRKSDDVVERAIQIAVMHAVGPKWSDEVQRGGE